MEKVESGFKGRDLGREIYGLAFLAFSFSLSLTFLPPLGLLLSTLTPVPLILVYLLYGRKIAAVMMGVIAFVVAVVGGFNYGLLFIAQYGLTALIVGESQRLRFSVVKTLLLSAAIPLAVGLFMTSVQVKGTASMPGGQEAGMFSSLESRMESSLQGSVEAYRKAGLFQGQPPEMADRLRETSRALARIVPALLFVGAFVGVLLNLMVVRFVAGKRYGLELFKGEAFKTWVIPDYWVWGLIGSGFVLLASSGFLETAALNATIVFSGLYLVQGFAVLFFLIEKWSLSFWLRGVIYFFIAVYPVALILLWALGLFDIWADFRKIKSRTEEKDEE